MKVKRIKALYKRLKEIREKGIPMPKRYQGRITRSTFASLLKRSLYVVLISTITGYKMKEISDILHKETDYGTAHPKISKNGKYSSSTKQKEKKGKHSPVVFERGNIQRIKVGSAVESLVIKTPDGQEFIFKEIEEVV